MEEAIQSSVYVSSPDFAGWLQKRGFHVSPVLIHHVNVWDIKYFLRIIVVLVAKALEEKMDCTQRSGDCLHG